MLMCASSIRLQPATELVRKQLKQQVPSLQQLNNQPAAELTNTTQEKEARPQHRP